MTVVYSIVLKCHGYSGVASHERCRAVEEHVTGVVEGKCHIEYVTMRELCVAGDSIQPTIEVVYSEGDHKELIPKIDDALSEIGLVAAKVLVSTVASHVVSAMIAGAGVGGLACSSLAGSASKGSRLETAAAALAGTLVGAAAGALVGKAAKKKKRVFIGTKNSGKWYIKRFP